MKLKNILTFFFYGINFIQASIISRFLYIIFELLSIAQKRNEINKRKEKVYSFDFNRSHIVVAFTFVYACYISFLRE